MQEVDSTVAAPVELETSDPRREYVTPTLTLLDVRSTAHSANTVSDGTGNLIS
jgi:hypothetical protein